MMFIPVNNKIQLRSGRAHHIFTLQSNGQIAADGKNLARTQVNVDALADFMLDQIASETWVGKAPLVATVAG